MLSRLDGLSVCHMLRNDQSPAHVHKVMLTARGTDVERLVWLEGCIDDSAVSPFGLGENLALARTVLGRAPGVQAP